MPGTNGCGGETLPAANITLRRRTTLPEGETFLDIDCTFGGIEIYVPSDWKVVFRCNTCLGGCQDKRFGGGVIDQNRILVIRGDLTFGGIEIKS